MRQIKVGKGWSSFARAIGGFPLNDFWLAAGAFKFHGNLPDTVRRSCGGSLEFDLHEYLST
jgi:hypothetical protein